MLNTTLQPPFFLVHAVCRTNQYWKQTHLSRYTGLLGFFLVLWFPAISYSSSIKMMGYAETRYSGMLGIDFGSLCEGTPQEPLKQLCNPHILINRIRPSAVLNFSDKLSLRATGNLQLTHFRLERPVTKIDDILTMQRFYMEVRTKYVDMRAGLQSFNWGPALLWSLTTPFVPQDPTDFNAELPGLWSVSATINYLPTGFFMLGVMLSPDSKYTLEFLRWKQTFGTTDVGLTVVEGGLKRRVSIGAEVKGTLLLGFWLEAALHIPYEEMQQTQDPKSPTFSFVVGVDYSFPVLEKLLIALQYYYNHAGLTDPSKYPFNSQQGLIELAQRLQSTSQSSNVTGLGLSSGGFLGAHYLLLTMQLQILEELSVSMTAIGNLIDPSVMVGPFVAWNFLDNFTLTLGAYFFLGPTGSEFAPGKIKIPVAGVPEDGVAISPIAVVFAWLRYNF